MYILLSRAVGGSGASVGSGAGIRDIRVAMGMSLGSNNGCSKKSFQRYIKLPGLPALHYTHSYGLICSSSFLQAPITKISGQHCITNRLDKACKE